MRSRFPWPVLGLTLAALALAGCGTQGDGGPAAGPDPADPWTALDLDAEYGGLTPRDEPVAFGDPALAAELAADAGQDAGDPLAADPEVLALEALAATPPDSGAAPRPRFTFLRVVWGQLQSPADTLASPQEGPETLDWSGSLRVDRGVIVVRRVILFERPGDHLVYPRPDRRAVAWVSRTGRHHDGLLVEIIEPPARPDSTGALPPPNRLHFDTPPLSVTFDVAALAGLERIVPVAPEGNAVRFSGFGLLAPYGCPKGFLGGLWRAEGDSSGTFQGRWMNLHGRLAGFVRGGWGYDGAGERVLVGKWIDRDGRFRGLLRGRWEPGAEPGQGGFRGHWANAAGTREGLFGGQYLCLPDRPGGSFAGRWATLCDDEATGQIE